MAADVLLVRGLRDGAGHWLRRRAASPLPFKTLAPRPARVPLKGSAWAVCIIHNEGGKEPNWLIVTSYIKPCLTQETINQLSEINKPITLRAFDKI